MHCVTHLIICGSLFRQQKITNTKAKRKAQHKSMLLKLLIALLENIIELIELNSNFISVVRLPKNKSVLTLFVYRKQL